MRLPTFRPSSAASEIGLVVVLSAVVLTVVIRSLLGAHAEEARHAFDERSDAMIDTIDASLGEVRAAGVALLDEHYRRLASEGSYPEDFRFVAERLVAANRAVMMVGKYDAVDADELDAYAESVLDSGLYRFEVHGIDGKGRAAPIEPAERYLPISRLEPRRPAALGLIGAELGADAVLERQLERAAIAGEPTLARLPADWPLGDSLVHFVPAYRGHHAPDSPEERIRQSAGGYLVVIDIPDVLRRLARERGEAIDLTVAIGDARGRREMIAPTPRAETPWLVRHVVRTWTTERTWSFDGTGLELTVTGTETYGPRLLLGISVAALVVFAIAALLVSHSLHRRRSTRAIALARERADKTLNAIQDPVFTLDVEGRVVHMNPAAAARVKCDREEARGRRIDWSRYFVEEGEDGKSFELEAAAASMPATDHTAFNLCRPDRRVEAFTRLTLTRTRGPDGSVNGFIVVLSDVTAERVLTRRLEHQAYHDALTGIGNRRHLEREIDALVGHRSGTPRTHALLYVDLDQFKIVNDTCGHSAGDRLLQDITGALRRVCRESDVVTRLGGDEFGLLFIDVDEPQARRMAERVLEFFRTYLYTHGERTFAVRASLGLVPFGEGEASLEHILSSADLACYAAKDNGRNGLTVYSPEDRGLRERSDQLSHFTLVQDALENDRFELHVQPLARVSAEGVGRIDHFEFLLRLRREDGTLGAPTAIIEAAERFGLIRELDRWVIVEALRKVVEEGGASAECSYSINISGQSAADPSLIGFIRQEYERQAIDPARIWFELTETAAIGSFAVAVELARGIRALGSKVALDDFGSGLASFGYLKHLPVDVLKIDGQFVRDVVDDEVDRAIVASMITVARSMSITTVAEFVENEAIVRTLAELGIDYAQGYHIGKPAPMNETFERLARETPPSARAA